MQDAVSPQNLATSQAAPGPCESSRATHALTFVGPIQQYEAWGAGDCSLSGGGDGIYDRKGCCVPKSHLVYAGSNYKPHAHIMGLLSGSVLPVGASGEVRLDQFDVDGSVYRVDWILNGNTVFTSFAAPFTMPYSNPAPGDYVIEAAAYDHTQAYSMSNAVTVSVRASALGPDTLQSGTRLLAGQQIVSPNGLFRAAYQSDGNFVLYGPGGPVVWTGTSGSPGHVEAEEVSGNVVIRNSAQQVIWQTGTHGNSGAGLRVRDDGRVAVVNRHGIVVWIVP